MSAPKRRLHWLAYLALAMASLSGQAFAQGPTPALTARIAGVQSEAAQSQMLRIEALDISVRMRGSIAETVVTARFANSGQQILEGDFTLAMPAGSVVTGYALDIGERMIDGVLVDQRQARIAYERLVRGRIDPGLAEVSRDNLFRTRVFPIPPGGARTIRLRFVTPLDPVAGYVLPLRETDVIGALSLTIEASGARPGALAIPGDRDARWSQSEGVAHYAINRQDVRVDGAISIAPARAEGLLLSRHGNGQLFFEIADSDADAARRRASAPAEITILWDRSLSRADDDLEAEIALLSDYVGRVRPRSIALVLFDSEGVERIAVNGAAGLAERLRRVRYRGATSLAVLAAARLPASDACLLFSDGLVTVDRREDFTPPCLLHAISSAADADRAWLARLARRSGGEAFDLSVRPAAEVLTRMTRRVPRVTDVRTTSGARIDYSLLDGGADGWRIVGPMPASGDIVVSLAGVEGESQRLYARRGAEVALDGPGALWAAERVAILAAGDERSRDEIVAFSRLYSVASPDVSFIVLENGRDYAQARIEPPAGAPADWLRDYRAVRESMEQAESGARAQRLGQVVAQWGEMREWWARRFDPARRPRGNDRSADGADGITMPPVTEQMVREMPPPIMPAPVMSAPTAPEARGESANADIVVTGGRIRGNAGAEQEAPPGRSRHGSITIEPWKPDRPYLAALDQASPAERERVFAEQQREHGALPAFWLDTADWAWRAGRRADAVALVLSALELPTRNSQTLAIVADRLLRYGETDRAIWLLERLAAAEDDRPQPRRTLALALARRAAQAPREAARADLARAISLLTEVVMTPWDGAYDGIEMIALVEANALIPRYRALGGSALALDPRLIARLDFDLRVTIEWQTEATDVDLWIDEPGGERAIYSNPRTAIGGRLSNDMTQGFGPEEYLLRRAPAGRFEVRANVFASDRLNPNGAQRVTARIIRDFGRASEREELVDLELLPDDPTRERRIGTVTFGPPGRAPDRPRPRARDNDR